MASAISTSLPYAGLVAGYLLLRWRVLGALGYSLTPLSAGTMLLTMPWALCLYLWRQFFPVGLSLFYDQEYVTNAAFFLHSWLRWWCWQHFVASHSGGDIGGPAAAFMVAWFFAFLAITHPELFALIRPVRLRTTAIFTLPSSRFLFFAGDVDAQSRPIGKPLSFGARGRTAGRDICGVDQR